MSAEEGNVIDDTEAFLEIKDGDVANGVVLADLDDDANGVPPLDSDDDDLEIDDTDDAENIQDEPMQEELIDHSIHCFEGHIDAVYSVAWSPTVPALVATGGSDDKTFLWRVGEDAYMETQGAVHELLGHTDTIGVISFSHDGSMLATGGMDGRVKIWNPLDGSCIRTLEGPGESIEWLKWHPRGNVILAGSADFTVWMWLAQTGACMQVFTGHAGPVTCGGFSSDGKIVLTGGGEGDDSLKLWDPKTGECKISVQGAHFHAAPLISLAIHMDSHIALTGSEDGTVKVVSIDNGRVLNTLVGQHNEDTSIEVVAFLPTLPLAATSGMDGKLVLWDVASWTARAVCEHPDGITSMVCHPAEPLVYTGCMDGVVRCWDARTGQCTHTFRGHLEVIQSLALSPDGNMVLSGSEDGTCRVFSLLEPQF